mmetsp:Transcript_64549/g.144978  ORF Transcript_64549/g.144978 Transcript_64549/m.144978 type:complete len:215 (+) Transcript_64549:1094-1738(+)
MSCTTSQSARLRHPEACPAESIQKAPSFCWMRRSVSLLLNWAVSSATIRTSVPSRMHTIDLMTTKVLVCRCWASKSKRSWESRAQVLATTCKAQEFAAEEDDASEKFVRVEPRADGIAGPGASAEDDGPPCEQSFASKVDRVRMAKGSSGEVAGQTGAREGVGSPSAGVVDSAQSISPALPSPGRQAGGSDDGPGLLPFDTLPRNAGASGQQST